MTFRGSKYYNAKNAKVFENMTFAGISADASSAEFIPAAAKKFIDENYFLDITVFEIAAYFSVSEGYFTHLFTKYIGVSPKKYLISKRIEEAKKLLETTELSSSEIAKKVGYVSVSRFYDAFRKIENITPTAYRKK